MLMAQAAGGRDWLDVAETLAPYGLALVSTISALLIAEVAHRRERRRSLEVQGLQMAEAERVRRAEAAAADERWRRDRVTDTVLEALGHTRTFHRSGQNAMHSLALVTNTPIDSPLRSTYIEMFVERMNEAGGARRSAEGCADLLAAYGLTDVARAVHGIPSFDNLDDGGELVAGALDGGSPAKRYTDRAASFDADMTDHVLELERLVRKYLTGEAGRTGAE